MVAKTPTRHASIRRSRLLHFIRSKTMDEKPVVHSDPEIMGGTPVFYGTRVPFSTLFDYLEAGDPLDVVLDQFPSVTRSQAVAALELARSLLESRASAA